MHYTWCMSSFDKTLSDDQTITSILEYWYSESVRERWFNSTPAFDEQITSSYESLWQAAAKGDYDHWKSSADGCLALCIVLDQFPLNMYRNQKLGFSTEAQSIVIAKYAVNLGFDKQLPKEQLAFLYMPLMHSENLQDQTFAVDLFSNAGLENNARFARHHRDIVSRFGRFPHRNTVLGRESSTEELEYLNSKEAFTG